MEKIDTIGALGIGLLYLSRVTMDARITDDELLMFKKQINDNLEQMNINSNSLGYWDSYLLYFFENSIDENGNIEYWIKPDVDFEYYRSIFISRTGLNILIASQKDNALEILGLEKADNHIVKRKKEKIKEK